MRCLLMPHELSNKTFELAGERNHVIAISRGAIDTKGFKELFTRVDELIQSLAECKVLIDLEDALYELAESEVDEIMDDLNAELWAANLKIAFAVCAMTAEGDQLLRLSTRLSKRGLTVSVFYGTKPAIDWLAEKPVSVS